MAGVAATLVAYACGGGAPARQYASSPTAPVASPGDQLPDLYLTVGDASARGGKGSSCWPGLPCGDTVSVRTQKAPLSGVAGSTLFGRFSASPLSSASVQAWYISDLPCDATLLGQDPAACGADQGPDGTWDWLYPALMARLGDGRGLSAAVAQETLRVTLPSKPGLYVLSILVQSTGNGSVDYGVLVDLLPISG